MRLLGLCLLDSLLISFATVIAFALRENLQFHDAVESLESQLAVLFPYFVATAGTAIIILPVSGLNKVMWCFSGGHNSARIAAVVIGTCLGAVSLSFFYNRLEGVARSLPFLQALVGIVLLEGARRVYALNRPRQRKASAHSRHAVPEIEISVLLVGVTRLAEIYLEALKEFHPCGVYVAGLIAGSRDCVGCQFSGCPILGVTEDIEIVVNDLEVHGITVKRVVILDTLDHLSKGGREALTRVAQRQDISLQLFPATLGFPAEAKELSSTQSETLSSWPSQLKSAVGAAKPQLVPRRLFWRVKRAMDLFGALCLLLVLAPVLFLVSCLVVLSTGFPVGFWQRRPGLGGKPFHVYKFRTMRSSRTSCGHALSDAQRVRRVGSFLRRTRLDELLQLYNILCGDMSFVGPRPLLQKDQPQASAARLQVRPGLTGWAQVVGGRDISPEDKLALDIWYVRHANFVLDLVIAARTIQVVIFGERISRPSIERAWEELRAAEASKSEEAYSSENILDALSIS